jgi:hypothetical protein
VPAESHSPRLTCSQISDSSATSRAGTTCSVGSLTVESSRRPLAEVLEDPSEFDLDEVNEALQGPFHVLREHGLDSRLADVIDRLAYIHSLMGLHHQSDRGAGYRTLAGDRWAGIR